MCRPFRRLPAILMIAVRATAAAGAAAGAWGVAAAELPPAVMQVFVARCQICHVPTTPDAGQPPAATRPLRGIGAADLDAAIAAALAAHPGGALRLSGPERELLDMHLQQPGFGR
jgi:mono/diheme cytochrome c family protein